MDYCELLTSEARRLSIDVSGKQAALLAYADLVLETNKSFNLTAIEDKGEFVSKHILDSLLGADLIPLDARLCDIGAGAGFPSAPLAILRDDLSVTALDATAKKMNFVSESARALGIKNLCAIAGRAEEQTKLFGSFDVITARAVSALPILLELSAPLLKVGGRFLAYKTDESEVSSCKNAMSLLGLKYVGAKNASLPDGSSRAILVFEKVSQTPKQYPRAYGAIKKRPL